VIWLSVRSSSTPSASGVSIWPPARAGLAQGQRVRGGGPCRGKARRAEREVFRDQPGERGQTLDQLARGAQHDAGAMAVERGQRAAGDAPEIGGEAVAQGQPVARIAAMSEAERTGHRRIDSAAWQACAIGRAA
jgi:hypothetical protein